MKELISLLFYVDSNDFKDEFHSKPYLKYVYKPPSSGPKRSKNINFLKAVNWSLTDHLYGLDPLKRRN